MASHARSEKEGAGRDRPNPDSNNRTQSSSREETERMSGQTKDQAARNKEIGQREKENAGSGQ